MSFNDSQDLSAASIIQTFTDIGGTIANLIPGIGPIVSQIGDLLGGVVSFIGDRLDALRNQFNELVETTAERFDFLGEELVRRFAAQAVIAPATFLRNLRGIVVSHFVVFDAAAAGNLLYHGALAVAKTLNTNDPVSFPIGDLDISED